MKNFYRTNSAHVITFKRQLPCDAHKGSNRPFLITLKYTMITQVMDMLTPSSGLRIFLIICKGRQGLVDLYVSFAVERGDYILYCIHRTVEGLYCQRQSNCLASSEILTPTPSPPGECVPLFGAGGGHTRWVERGWGVNSSEDARHCSVLYICKYSTMTAHIHGLQVVLTFVFANGFPRLCLASPRTERYCYYNLKMFKLLTASTV